MCAGLVLSQFDCLMPGVVPSLGRPIAELVIDA